MNYILYLDELFEDYSSYLEALEHAADGEYQEYDWCNENFAKIIYGEEVYNFIVNAYPVRNTNPALFEKMKKELLVSYKLKEIELDFT